ncbi:SCP2 domain-containing protein [Neptunomonas sp.]|uniref:ubiquinone biosynthesis accessory factor UbiJ n=1 Tax=Neptunomonas sp. TaxID=1971898 RepID=UPI00356AEAA1
MANDMLHALILTPLESAINSLLQSDSVTCQALKRLTGKVIQIEATDLKQSLFIIPFDAGVQLQAHFEGDADVTLSGPSNRLLQLISSDNKAEHFFGNGITVSGETSLANQFQQLLAETHIDWEAFLADYIGDLPAHQLSEFSKNQLNFVKRVGSSFSDNIHEYIQEEAQLLPTRPEAEAFMQDVDHLKDRAERLGARIRALEQKL